MHMGCNRPQAAAQQALAWERAAQALQRLATEQRGQAEAIVQRAAQVKLAEMSRGFNEMCVIHAKSTRPAAAADHGAAGPGGGHRPARRRGEGETSDCENSLKHLMPAKPATPAAAAGRRAAAQAEAIVPHRSMSLKRCLHLLIPLRSSLLSSCFWLTLCATTTLNSAFSPPLRMLADHNTFARLTGHRSRRGSGRRRARARGGAAAPLR